MKTVFSKDRLYRYTLHREWLIGHGVCMFIGLNPSTADEVMDDPTVRRCIGFAAGWGFRTLIMTNIFAFRATDPANMMVVEDPVGEDNDIWLQRAAKESDLVVAAWGTHGAYRERSKQVREMLKDLYVLRLTKEGHPSHPLYLPRHLEPIAWV